MKKITVLVSGEKESPDGIRAFYLFRDIDNINVIFRENRLFYYISVIHVLFFRLERVVYFVGFDTISIILTMLRSTFFPIKIVYDTGDLQCELSHSFRSRFFTGLVCLLENWLFRNASLVIPRTETLRQILMDKVKVIYVIRDGVDFGLYSQYTAIPEGVVVGTTGTFHRDMRTGRISGSEVIEVLIELKKMGIEARGLIAGEGSVYRILRKMSRDAGVEVDFVEGWTEYRRFPELLQRITFAINLQTNDAIGRVRLGGKIPPFLATGRYIFSTDVPECVKYLKPEFIVHYNGSYDRDFPSKVARRIAYLLEHRGKMNERMLGLSIAERYFDYRKLSRELKNILRSKVL